MGASDHGRVPVPALLHRRLRWNQRYHSACVALCCCARRLHSRRELPGADGEWRPRQWPSLAVAAVRSNRRRTGKRLFHRNVAFCGATSFLHRTRADSSAPADRSGSGAFSRGDRPRRSARGLSALARFLLNFRCDVRSHAALSKVHSLDMSGEFEITCRFQVPFEFTVFFTEDVFSPANSLVRDLLAQRRREKLLVVIEERIVAAMPDLTAKIEEYFRDSESIKLVPASAILPGGEVLKANYAAVKRLHGLIEQHGLSRHSYVAAIGGGALLDVAGFAAATAHRGIRHVRFPTTSLSQADAGVGVKNAINAFGKKNFIGTFAPPFAVINDSQFLRILPNARKSAGYIEAVKVALIRDAAFFTTIETDADALSRFEPAAMR